jgi:HTH-type transcriptional regulator / antitoxin HipB
VQSIARTPKQIGAAMRRRRRTLGLNQTAIGKKAHLRQATISALEAGDPGTELRTLCEVLAALGLELVIQPRTKVSPADLENIF